MAVRRDNVISIQPETEQNQGEEAVVFIGEESSKRRVNAYIPKYISMATLCFYGYQHGTGHAAR